MRTVSWYCQQALPTTATKHSPLPCRPGCLLLHLRLRFRSVLSQILHVVPGSSLDVLHPRCIAVLLLVGQVPLEEELRGGTALFSSLYQDVSTGHDA